MSGLDLFSNREQTGVIVTVRQQALIVLGLYASDLCAETLDPGRVASARPKACTSCIGSALTVCASPIQEVRSVSLHTSRRDTSRSHLGSSTNTNTVLVVSHLLVDLVVQGVPLDAVGGLDNTAAKLADVL